MADVYCTKIPIACVEYVNSWIADDPENYWPLREQSSRTMRRLWTKYMVTHGLDFSRRDQLHMAEIGMMEIMREAGALAVGVVRTNPKRDFGSTVHWLVSEWEGHLLAYHFYVCDDVLMISTAPKNYRCTPADEPGYVGLYSTSPDMSVALNVSVLDPSFVDKVRGALLPYEQSKV